jgi:rubrerythrin
MMAIRKTAVKKATAKKTAPKKTTAKKAVTKKKTAAKTAPRKSTAKKTVKRSRKSAASVSAGDGYVCAVCGLSVTVDEECGCVDTCDIICCGQQMEPKG